MGQEGLFEPTGDSEALRAEGGDENVKKQGVGRVSTEGDQGGKILKDNAAGIGPTLGVKFRTLLVHIEAICEWIRRGKGTVDGNW